MEFLAGWLDLWQAISSERDGLYDLVPVAYYISVTSDKSQRQEVFKFMQDHLGESGQKTVVTIADSLRAEGWEKGLAEGEARGEVRGEAKEAARAVLDILDAREIEVPEQVRERVLACSDLPTLQSWRRRAITAAKAIDVFDA